MESISAPSLDLVLLKRAFLRLLPESEEATTAMMMALDAQGLIAPSADRDEFHLAIWLALAKALDHQLNTSGPLKAERRISLALYGVGVPVDRMSEAADSIARSLGCSDAETSAWSEFLHGQLDSLLSNPIE